MRTENSNIWVGWPGGLGAPVDPQVARNSRVIGGRRKTRRVYRKAHGGQANSSAQASQQVWTSFPGGIGWPTPIPLSGGYQTTVGVPPVDLLGERVTNNRMAGGQLIDLGSLPAQFSLNSQTGVVKPELTTYRGYGGKKTRKARRNARKSRRTMCGSRKSRRNNRK